MSQNLHKASNRTKAPACLCCYNDSRKNRARPQVVIKNLFPELKQRFTNFELNEYDEQIEQLNQIFKLIFEDEDLPSPVKQQLARLQIYVFITAVQEDGFSAPLQQPGATLC